MDLRLLCLLAAMFAAALGQRCADYAASDSSMCAQGADQTQKHTLCSEHCENVAEPNNPEGGQCKHNLCMCDGDGAIWPNCADASVAGDPWYFTFGWVNFGAHLNGRHLLFRSTRSASFGPIAVWNTNECMTGEGYNCDVIGGGRAWIGKVDVELFKKKQTIEFEYDRSEQSNRGLSAVKVNGKVATLPYEYVNNKGDEFFNIYRVAYGDVVLDTSIGVRITVHEWNGASFSIPRAKHLVGKFEGVLGNLDGNMENDLRLPNGTVLTQEFMHSDEAAGDIFINEWMENKRRRGRTNTREKRCNSAAVKKRVDELCNDKITELAAQCMQGPYQTAYSYRLKVARSSRYASVMRSMNSYVPAEMKRRLDFALRSCATDVCLTKAPKDPLTNGACDAMVYFESYCKSYKYRVAGVKFDAYHSAKFCPRQCPPKSTYRDCAGCQRACGSAKAQRCEKQCLGAGCVCNNGYYFRESDKKCVRKRQC